MVSNTDEGSPKGEISARSIDTVLHQVFGEGIVACTQIDSTRFEGEYGASQRVQLSYAGSNIAAVLMRLKPKITDREIDCLDNDARDRKEEERRKRKIPTQHPAVAYKWGIRMDTYLIDSIERFSKEYGSEGTYPESVSGRVFAACKTLYEKYEDANGLLVPKGISKQWLNEHILFNPHDREIPILSIDAASASVQKDKHLHPLYRLLIERTGGTQEYTLDSSGARPIAEGAGD